MIFLRFLTCYMFVIVMMMILIWWVGDLAAGFLLLFSAIAFIPSVIGTIFVLMPIEVFFEDKGQGFARLVAILAAGAIVPVVTLAVLSVYWGKLPKVSSVDLFWVELGVGWAFIWWLSSWLFPTRWAAKIDT